MKEYQIEIHKCKKDEQENRNLTISKHKDDLWWLDKEIGMRLHIRINYCPFCGKELEK